MDAYLWLLPVLLPAVGFFWCCCGCAFDDDFSTAKTGYTLTKAFLSQPATYSVTGGHLVADSVGVSTYTQGCPLPASGTITVEAEVYNDPSYNGGVGYGNSGIAIGTAASGSHRVFWGPRWQFGDSAFSVVSASGTSTTFVLQAGNDGDVYRIELTAGGGSVWNAEVFINGVSKKSASATFSFPDPIAIGVTASNGGEWDNLSLTAG